MRLHILAVGQKMPAWVTLAWDDYYKRFTADHKPVFKEVKAEPRTAGKTAAQLMAQEGQRLEAAYQQLSPGCLRIVLDERGKALTTLQLAAKWQNWQQHNHDACLFIGGPDGLDPSLKAKADETWCLSAFTLPHAMVRVLLIEQLYRSWSVITHHPYHRE